MDHRSVVPHPPFHDGGPVGQFPLNDTLHRINMVSFSNAVMLNSAKFVLQTGIVSSTQTQTQKEQFRSSLLVSC